MESNQQTLNSSNIQLWIWKKYLVKIDNLLIQGPLSDKDASY